MTDEQFDALTRACCRWQGTRFHHAERLRGVGVDCANLLAAVYHDAGFIPNIELGAYPQQWMLHRTRERFLEIISEWADEVPESDLRRGDALVMRYGRCYSHGAVYLGERRIFHAFVGRYAEFDHLDAYLPRAIRYFRVRAAT